MVVSFIQRVLLFETGLCKMNADKTKEVVLKYLQAVSQLHKLWPSPRTSHLFYRYRVNSSAFFNFRSVPFQFNSIDRKLNRKGTGLERERNRNGMGLEWEQNGNGTEREWSGNGTGTERKWNGNGTKVQWTDNECSVLGTWPVIRLHTSWEP